MNNKNTADKLKEIKFNNLSMGLQIFIILSMVFIFVLFVCIIYWGTTVDKQLLNLPHKSCYNETIYLNETQFCMKLAEYDINTPNEYDRQPTWGYEDYMRACYNLDLYNITKKYYPENVTERKEVCEIK
jgi:hypothetical protein